jgi:predicted lipoprotein with Yx(FWY)xxD motif
MLKKALVLSPVLLFALAACGSNGTNASSGSGSGSSAGGSSNKAASSSSVLAVRNTKLGKVLVDSKGQSVYLFTADSKNHSSCNATCLNYWPAVKATGTVPGSIPGITAKIGTTSDMSGGKIVTANGWPLYTYVKDTKPGDVTGQGTDFFGGKWWVLTPSGAKVTSTGSSSGSPSSSSSSSGGGGYAY